MWLWDIQHMLAAFILDDFAGSVVLVCSSCCETEGRLIVLTESWGSTLQSWLLPGWLPPWVHIAAACWPAWQLQPVDQRGNSSLHSHFQPPPPPPLPSLCQSPGPALTNLCMFCLYSGSSQRSCSHSLFSYFLFNFYYITAATVIKSKYSFKPYILFFLVII